MKKFLVVSSSLFFGGILLLIGGIFGLLTYINTDHFSRMAQEEINIRIPGTMQWTRFSLSPFQGEITLEGVRLSLENEELASVKQLNLNLDLNPSKWLQRQVIVEACTLDSPKVTIELLEGNEVNIGKAFPKGEKSEKSEDTNDSSSQWNEFPFNVIVQSLRIIDGACQYRSHPDDMTVHLEGLDISGQGNLFAQSMALITKTGPIQFHQPGMNINVQNTSLELRCLEETIEKLAIAIRSEAADLDLTGTIAHLLTNDRTLNLQLDGNLATDKIVQMVGLEENISGDMTFRGMVSGKPNDPVVHFTVNYPDAVIMGRKVKKAAFEGKMDSRVVTISSFEIDHNHARLLTQGNIVLTDAFPGGFLQSGADMALRRINWDVQITGDEIQPGKILEEENVRGIGGACAFKAHLAGNMTDPQARLSLKADQVTYLNYPSLDADISLSLARGIMAVDQFDLASCSAEIGLGGKVILLEADKENKKGTRDAGERENEQKGRIYRLLKSPKLDLTLDSRKPIDLARCMEALGKLAPVKSALEGMPDDQISGTITLHTTIQGDIQSPIIDLDLDADNIRAAGEHLDGLSLSAKVEDNILTIPTLKVALDKDVGVMTDARLRLDGSNAFEMSLTSYGDGIDLTKIQAIAKQEKLQGVATCHVAAKGSFDAPEVSGTIQLKNLVVMEKPLEDFSADISMKDGRAEVKGRFNFDIDAAYALKSGDFSAKVLFNRTDLLPWLSVAGVKDIDGRLTGKVMVEGNASTPDQLTARCTIDDLSIGHRKYKEAPIQIKKMNAWSDGKSFNVEKFKTVLPEKGELTVAASGELSGIVRAEASAHLPLSVASVFVSDLPLMEGAVDLDFNGQLDLSTHLSGDGVAQQDRDADMGKNRQNAQGFGKGGKTHNTPKSNKNMKDQGGVPEFVKGAEIDAKVTFHQVAVTLPEDFGRVEKINGTITGNLNKITIPRIKGEFGTGDFALNGEVKLVELMPKTIRAGLTATSLPMDMVDGLEGELHSNLEFQAGFDKNELKNGLVNGELVLEGASWSQDISVEKRLISTLTEKKRVRKTVQSKENRNPLLDRIRLDVAVRGATPFVVDNNLAYMEIHPNINIQGTAAAPRVSGRSEIDPGTITYQASEFTLTRGIVDFVNPYAIEPELDIESNRTVRDWEVTLAVSGTPDNLNFGLSSDPQLEDADILSLLLRGKTVSELISAEGGTTLSAAGMLSQVAASAVSDNLKVATGLDIFEMGFGNDSDSNALSDLNVTVGKKITDKITVKYGAETEDGEMIHKTVTEYKMTDNVSVSGFQDSAGQFGGEVRYRLEFK